MEIEQAVKAMSALAQESRLRVFRLLVRCGEQGMPAGQIAQQLELPAATLSFHLKELSHAGLIEQRRQGRSIIYSLNAELMREFLAYLMEDCCQGRPELCQADYHEEQCGAPSCRAPAKRTRRKSRRA